MLSSVIAVLCALTGVGFFVRGEVCARTAHASAAMTSTQANDLRNCANKFLPINGTICDSLPDAVKGNRSRIRTGLRSRRSRVNSTRRIVDLVDSLRRVRRTSARIAPDELGLQQNAPGPQGSLHRAIPGAEEFFKKQLRRSAADIFDGLLDHAY